ncbi:hypothetical protein [Desulfosporosinus sp. SB140]|uniref:hypothetical protein n=1 Tax=Desulfosporosinus paludis TaxID=3115649 RepID=UPI00389042F3
MYYPLNHGVLRQDIPRGVSNVCLGENVGIEVHEGWVLLVLLKGRRVDGGKNGRDGFWSGEHREQG